MTQPRKIPAQAGLKPRICRFQGRRLDHLANEAVRVRNRPIYLKIARCSLLLLFPLVYEVMNHIILVIVN